MSDFVEEYKKLNTQQKQAVDKLEGPLLVVAGPGTGKTQLLSMRVANILQKTDTQSHEILCLTFTDKAAQNMRERLLNLAGGDGRAVVVKTFHSFGAEIIGTFPEYFWNASSFSAAPDGLQTEIVHDILSALPLSDPLALRFGGNPTMTNSVISELDNVKKAGLTPSKLKAIVDANLAYIEDVHKHLQETVGERVSKKVVDKLHAAISGLPDQGIAEQIAPLQSLSVLIKDTFNDAYTEFQESGKTTSISEWKKSWWETRDGKPVLKDQRRNLWYSHLANVYDKYRTILHKRGYFDYADMIIEVITQLEQNPDLRADVQERFQHVLIDEFQDTNDAQMRLAHLVADHHTNEGKPNIMVVGDDDQSIFKFQGAELNNLINFRRNYPSAETVVLEQNYRSNQNVIDYSKQIIEQAQYRLVNEARDIKKNIQAAAKHTDGKIEYDEYVTQSDQYASVADKVAVAYSDNKSVVVIARNNQSLVSIAKSLQAKDVPISYYQQNNIFDNHLVMQIIDLAELLNAIMTGGSETVNEFMPRVMRQPHWQLKPEILWAQAVSNRQEPNWIESIKSDTRTKTISDWLDDATQVASNEPVAVLLERLLGLSKGSQANLDSLHESYVNAKHDSKYLADLSAIRTLRSLMGELGKGKQLSLKEFIKLIQVYQENEIIVADESPFVTGSKTVELVTVHKAKGLEFDEVFIVDAVDSDWRPRNNAKKAPANLSIKPAGDNWDDYVRLMYVAVTRAVSGLHVSSYLNLDNGKPVTPTPIITTTTIATTSHDKIQNDPIKLIENSLTWPALNSDDEKSLLSPILQKYQLSVTHLLNFLDVSRGGPNYFFERNILRLPEAKTASQAHGTAMHAVMEFAQRQISNGGSIATAKLVEKYNNSLEQENIEKADYQRWSAEAATIINRLFNELKIEIPKNGVPEKPIKDLLVGKARLNGKLDRVVVNNNEVEIADYKTGGAVSNISKISPSAQNAIKVWRQKTQLTFYALLANNFQEYADKTMMGKMIYLHADTQKDLERSYSPSREEIDRLQGLIEVIWPKIMKLDLPNTDSYQKNYLGVEKFEQDLLEGKV